MTKTRQEMSVRDMVNEYLRTNKSVRDQRALGLGLADFLESEYGGTP